MKKGKTILTLCLLFVCLVFPVRTWAATGINVEYHSQAEIKQMAKKLNLQKSLPTGYSEQPAWTAPYKLGKLNDATVQNALNTLNMVRYIAGIPYNVQNSSEYEKLAQAATVVNAANGVMTHTPARPEGMSEELYQWGYEGASSSNLGWGYGNLYRSIIDGWMADKDNSNINRVGHRRWCLNPGMKFTGFGVSGSHSAMYAFDGGFDSTAYSGVAWPAQNTPLEFWDNSRLPWSISMGKTLDMQSIHVTLTRKNDGKVWNFSSSGSDGDFYVNNNNYGQRGCIIFRPQGITEYNANDSFRVEISGSGLSVSYDVNFFNIHEHTGGTATCQRKARCSICGVEYGGYGKHQYEKYVKKEAACTTTGQQCNRCKICRSEEAGSLQTIPAKGHSWNDGTITVRPTCTSPGRKTYYCVSCTASKNESVKAKGHSWYTHYTIDQHPTCTTDGYRSIHCYECNSIKSGSKDTLKATGHRWGSWITKISPTYTKEGREERACVNCQSKESRKIDKLSSPNLAAPKLVSAEAMAYNKVTVRWQKISNATEYRIYYKPTTSSKWKRVGTVSSSKTSFTHTSSKSYPITVGQKYQYTVRGYNSKSKKAGAYNAKGLTARTIPNTVKLGKIFTDYKMKEVTVTWNKTAGCDYYLVYRKTEGSGWKKLASIRTSSGALQYTDKNPVKGKRNIYSVKAYYSKSKVSGKYDARGLGVFIPQPTVSVTPGKVTLSGISSSAYNKVTVKWKKTSNATEYRIYYKPTTSSKWKRVGTVSSSKTSFTHTSSKSYPITVGRKYQYTVRAYNSKSKKAGAYNSKGLTVKTIPNTVKLGKISMDSKKKAVTVTWNKTSGGNYYLVYRKTTDSGWKKLASIKTSSGVLKYTDKSPVKGKKNIYSVKVYDSKSKISGKYDKKGLSVSVPKK